MGWDGGIDRRAMLGGLGAGALLLGTGGASAATGEGFRRAADARPILGPDRNAVFYCPMRKAPVRWRALHAFNPAAVVHDDAVYMLFRAEDDSGTMTIGGHSSRLGLARSRDGMTFQALPAPVLYPDEDGQRDAEWDGGCEDPRLAVRDDGLFVCTYTQYNRRAIRIGVASSRDLIFWTKHGAAFAGSAHETLMQKSAAIVHRLVDDGRGGGKLVAARIGGRYWMLFGQGKVYAAHSEDMIRWSPVEAAPGQLKVVMAPRPGRFDSFLVEAGPPPVLTRDGIVMLYNGRNVASGGDPARGALEYSAGRALLDPRDPTRVIARADTPFLAPELAWEKTGQYAAGTTFIEGLVRFRDRWLLYYGSADSVVGVAISSARSI